MVGDGVVDRLRDHVRIGVRARRPEDTHRDQLGMPRHSDDSLAVVADRGHDPRHRRAMALRVGRVPVSVDEVAPVNVVDAPVVVVVDTGLAAGLRAILPHVVDEIRVRVVDPRIEESDPCRRVVDDGPCGRCLDPHEPPQGVG